MAEVLEVLKGLVKPLTMLLSDGSQLLHHTAASCRPTGQMLDHISEL